MIDFHFIIFNVFSCFGFFKISSGNMSSKKNIKKERISSCGKNPVTLTAEKKNLVIVLPFFGMISLASRTSLKNSISEKLSFLKDIVIFKSSTCISEFFQFKDNISCCLHSSVVCKFSCGRCNATYYSEKCRHLSVRVGEHSGASLLTRKKSISKKYTALKDHMFFCDHIVSIDDLTTNDSDFHVKVKESFFDIT